MAMDDIISFTLLRHGVTKENKERRYIGWSNVSLDEEAILMLKANQQVAAFQFVVSSDLKRCLQTAAYFSNGKKIIEESGLREINFGSWEKKTYDELRNDHMYCNWLTDPCSVAPPNGEAFVDFQERVIEAWEKIISTSLKMEAVKKVLVVSHGGPIRVLLANYVLPKKSFWDWPVPHCSGYTITFSREALIRGERECILSQVEPFTVKEDG